MFQINVTGTWSITQLIAQKMVNAEKGGSICFISSIVSISAPIKRMIKFQKNYISHSVRRQTFSSLWSLLHDQIGPGNDGKLPRCGIRTKKDSRQCRPSCLCRYRHVKCCWNRGGDDCWSGGCISGVHDVENAVSRIPHGNGIFGQSDSVLIVRFVPASDRDRHDDWWWISAFLSNQWWFALLHIWLFLAGLVYS